MKEKWQQFKAWIEKNKVAAGAGALGLLALFYFWFKSRSSSNTTTGEVAKMSYSPGSGGSGGGSSGTSTASSDVETLSTVLKTGFEQQNSSLANALEGFANAVAQSRQNGYTGQYQTSSAMSPNIPTPNQTAYFVQPASIFADMVVPFEEWPEFFTPDNQVILANLPQTNYNNASPNAPAYDTVDLGDDKGISSDGDYFTATSYGDKQGTWNNFGEFVENKNV